MRFETLFSVPWIYQQTRQQQQQLSNVLEENTPSREIILLNATTEKSEHNKEARTLVDMSDLNSQTTGSDGPLPQHKNEFSYQTFRILEDSFLHTLKSSLTGVTVNREQVVKRLGKNLKRGALKHNKPVKRIGY